MLGMDKITEEIAHFIGMFHTNLEQARARESYTDFSFVSTTHEAQSSPVDGSTFAADYEFEGYDPYLNYRPLYPIFPLASPWPTLHRQIENHDALDRLVLRTDMDLSSRAAFASTVSFQMIVPPLEPPGSVANYFHQHVILSDNDVFSVGGHGFVVSAEMVDPLAVLQAAQPVLQLSPLADLVTPGSAGEIITLVRAAAEALEDADYGASDYAVMHQGETLSGIYVNGHLVTEAPKLEDYHSFDDSTEDETEDEDGGFTVASHYDHPLPDASVTITLGGNTVLNDAVLKSLWSGAKVTAVVGDHFEINAIIQINAIWDMDDFGSGLSHWSEGSDPNDIFNIASFERQAPGTPQQGAESISDQFPNYWSVTEINGDLMIVNWLEQYIFMTDNDVGIVSASGAQTSVITGDNTGINHTSIFELGYSYDLIIIGGSVYDASIIEQINVLFDSDQMGAMPGFQTNGAGEVSSSANLLWNQASIHNIGGEDRFSALPDSYIQAALSLANGDGELPDALLNDPAFAGLAGLRVLYISGDLINLQYIRQTSIVGDNDQIALAMDAVIPNLDADWTVETGGNALINNAAILDLDSLGSTYVGGEQYSQETLIQAELISSQPDLGSQDPTLLASEAVLFLDETMLDDNLEPSSGVSTTTDPAQSQDDGLQTLLA